MARLWLWPPCSSKAIQTQPKHTSRNTLNKKSLAELTMLRITERLFFKSAKHQEEKCFRRTFKSCVFQCWQDTHYSDHHSPVSRTEFTIPLQRTLQQICPHLSWQITEIITACKTGHSQYSCTSKQLKNCKNIKQHGRGRNISGKHLSAGEEPAAKHSLLAAGVEFTLCRSCGLGTPTGATMLRLGNGHANYSAKYSRFV